MVRTEEQRARQRESQQRYRERHPEKTRAASREYMRRIRLEQPEKARADYEKYSLQLQQRNARIIFDAKSVPCCECGNEYPPIAMDFHHRDPATKERRVALAVNQKWSVERLLREIEKCDVICANCHRIHHGYKKEYAWWDQQS